MAGPKTAFGDAIGLALTVFAHDQGIRARVLIGLPVRTRFFALAYSASPRMAISMVNVGAKYPVTFVAADGDALSGAKSYKLHLPVGILAALLLSVTVYDPENFSGLDNG
jgi:hypothetical protein